MSISLRIAPAVLIVSGVIALAGCASTTESASQTPAPITATPAAGPDLEIARTCAMLSLVVTTANNASLAEARGTLSTQDAAAIINTIPDTLNAIVVLSSGLASQVSALKDSINETAPLIEGAIFNPDAPPYRDAFTELQNACVDNGTEVIGVPNYPGG